MNVLVSQIRLETKLWFRQKQALLSTLAFPVFFMFLFGAIWRGSTWGGMPAIDYLVPGIIVMAMMSTCIMGATTWLVEERDKGIFRRLSITPLNRQAIIGGQIAHRYLVVLGQTAVLIAIGVGVYKANIGGNLLLFGGIVTLGAVCFLSMGFALSALIKSVKSAQPISMIVLYVLMFLGGCFIPLDAIPHSLLPVCNVLPSTNLSEALRQVAIGGMGLREIWRELLISGGWLVGSFIVAVKCFKWE